MQDVEELEYDPGSLDFERYPGTVHIARAHLRRQSTSV